MTTEPTPAQDLRSALQPFAALADAILSEAPSGAENIVLFSGCDGKSQTISMDQLRAATAALAQPAENAKAGEVVAMREDILERLRGVHRRNPDEYSEICNIIDAIRTLPLPAAEEKAGVGEVIEADRQAALDLVSPDEARRIASGTCDDHQLVQLLAQHRRQSIASLSPAAHADVREALSEQVRKFVDNYFAPWGSWKTAWWEGEVSDNAAYSAENALKHVANIVSRSTPPAALDEGDK
ncbi:hypothetical protein HHL08_15905 [Sphingobium sp. AR-3-1]|uniref:Uncharacterized protein n=1 Tax=Sphingobium psychrophilum TaxID=2728834 RepID=A0A7X9WXD5_9SPHN|nr:hypothetical protein [Sphingobium psychrophilum]NML11615.1 hypothetical protein [Sphingobium psychrophilum]